MPSPRARRSSLPLSTAALFTVALVAVTRPSGAALGDCPPGSSQREDHGFSWCEPSVCATDAQCQPGEVCRPVPLCMQVGSLEGAPSKTEAGGQRLVVTQRCAPDKSCPATTVCSDMGRCLAKDTAEKMGLLAAPTTAATSAPEAKKTCGCSTPGARTGGGTAAVAIAAAAAALAVQRRRRSAGADRG